MTGLKLEKILPYLTFQTTLWLGLGVLSAVLGLLLWTRWGEGRVLRKAFLVSLGIHALVAVYANTVSLLPRIRSNLVELNRGGEPSLTQLAKPAGEIRVPIRMTRAGMPISKNTSPEREKERGFGVSSGTGLVEKPVAAPEPIRTPLGTQRPPMPELPVPPPNPRKSGPELAASAPPNRPLAPPVQKVLRPAPKPAEVQLARIDNAAMLAAPRDRAPAREPSAVEDQPDAGPSTRRRDLSVRPRAADRDEPTRPRAAKTAGSAEPLVVAKGDLLALTRDLAPKEPTLRAAAPQGHELPRTAAAAPLAGPETVPRGSDENGAEKLAVVRPGERQLFRRPAGSPQGTEAVRRTPGRALPSDGLGPLTAPTAAAVLPPTADDRSTERPAGIAHGERNPLASAAPGPAPAPTASPARTAEDTADAEGEDTPAALLASRAPLPRRDGSRDRAEDAPPPRQRHGSDAAPEAEPDAARPSLALAPAPRETPIPQVRPGEYTGIAPMYAGRIGLNRKQRAQLLGATQASEQAVELALHWLEEHQDSDGRWSAAEFSAHCPPGERPCSGPCAYGDADTATTGLALLAYLGAGYTQRDGRYRRAVRGGLDWLIDQQKPDGDLRGRDRNVGLYCHSIASLALTEAYAMTGDAKLRQPVTRAVQFIVSAQNPETGGWRYFPYDEWDAAWSHLSAAERANPILRDLMTTPRERMGDSSVFGWMVMALKSASASGIEVPAKTWDGAANWVARVSAGAAGGLARYQPWDAEPKPSMTAEILLCREFLNTGRGVAAEAEAARYILDHPPASEAENIYYWYYATMAMFQRGGADWTAWNDLLRDDLVARQSRRGHRAGSWDPESTKYGGPGGRIYQTALATFSLEVYYRYLRLYGEER